MIKVLALSSEKDRQKVSQFTVNNKVYTVFATRDGVIDDIVYDDADVVDVDGWAIDIPLTLGQLTLGQEEKRVNKRIFF